ncbi:uncharacterized protein EI97DRAFT_92282 [Westerdykella ornata]|uniref:Uncharacterized protein n=1 Tax=Westerdykella ornata TaxID=318751 RepID=A0A6A6JE47_WESOR|nr:uncharacterized protein EI97DRAFT_92282 [Westerdykella ornata]KAF2274890.1 hypothetical protein EI97DRAFT_92282 [Westerdykella ornata]
MSSFHSRNASEETNATTGSSNYNLIMEHVLQYPGSYEIPLRTMYTLNCVPRAQPLPKDLSRAPSPTTTSPISRPSAWNEAESSAMRFTSQLMNHLGALPTQTSSLPPAFIVSFVSRCFHPCLALVDFPQALTALDYLRDLEKRRCKEYVSAFERLGIRIENFDADVKAVAEQYPGIALWAKNMHGKNKKAESYYAIMYLGLRRWILINELSLQPFNKLNCMGMLNTLLPPQSPSGNSRLPTPLLTHQVLKEERDSFFEYIRKVQKHGPSVLRPVIEMNKGPGDQTGWDCLQKTLDKYLRVAKKMIDDCVTAGVDDFTAVEEARKGKKTDSGVSFGADQRPGTATTAVDKPLPMMPTEARPTKGMSKMERLAREFRRMRVKTRPDVEEIIDMDRHNAAHYLPQPRGDEGKGNKSLKKARSFANIGHLRSSNPSSASLASRKNSDVVPFDPEQMKRHRQKYEAAALARG